MKVKDLIKELEKMPQDASVWHIWDGEPRTEIEMVYKAKNGDVMTISEGMPCYTDEFRPEGAPDEKQDPSYKPLTPTT